MLKWGVYFWGSFWDPLFGENWIKNCSKTGGGLSLSFYPTPPSHTLPPSSFPEGNPNRAPLSAKGTFRNTLPPSSSPEGDPINEPSSAKALSGTLPPS